MCDSLVIEGVIKRIGHKLLLSDIYLEMQIGDIIGVFGRNGSGKSTLFKIVYGIESAENCFIKANQTPINKPYRIKNLMAFSPQDSFLPPNLTVKNVIKLFFKQTIPDNLTLRFQEHFNSKIRHLSGGEKKLLELYVTLCANSKFVILDEPFNHLSPLMIDEVKLLIKERSRTKGIIISDHSFHDVLDLANRKFFLKDGKLKRITTKAELIEMQYVNSYS